MLKMDLIIQIILTFVLIKQNAVNIVKKEFLLREALFFVWSIKIMIKDFTYKITNRLFSI